jgi:predicted  nucleic acid-binding Zn-ribbon protein
VGNNLGQVLLSLNEADQQLAEVVNKQQGIEKKQSILESELAQIKSHLLEYESLLAEKKAKYSADESRLDEEQQKILERRKSLSDLGGAKAAKLIEREIDIAGRALQALEERSGQSLIEVEKIQDRINSLAEQASEIEATLKDFNSNEVKVLDELKKERGTLDKKRNKLLTGLEDRLRSLYSRVNARYPSGAIAIASKQSCRVCFRALPPQTYNQIIAGNIHIQCPGCSRILVYMEENK